MRIAIILAALVAFTPLDTAFAQLAGIENYHIAWEVKNRFRLFRRETDFLRLAAASRDDGILEAERRLERDTKGQGWAKDIVANLCVDNFGNLLQTCERDGVRENYLTPRDYAVGLTISGPVQTDATCVWSFDSGSGPLRQMNAACNGEVRIRVPGGTKTVASVDIPLGDGTAQRVVTEIEVRDVLIAGMGDSIAAGEGNPDRAIQLEGAFCFRRFGGGQYYRPGRAGFTGDRSCENGPASPTAAKDWGHHGARWMSPACHRSLYSYQVRTALALAIEQRHLAVTFLPLACTGATIEAGMFTSQRADDCPSVVGIDICSGTSPAQFTELKQLMADVRRVQPQRTLDMVLLTVGANDVRFASLVANVIVNAATERVVLRQGGGIATVQDSQKALEQNLPSEFARLRTALKPYVGGNLARVVFVSYGNPAMQSKDTACPGGRDGLDVHPAFSANGPLLKATSEFVNTKFLPALKALATCVGSNVCRDPLTDRMTFVDSHQAEFVNHGMCAHGPADPQFDRQCLPANGNAFVSDLVAAADDPMACQLPASDYLPYAPRARWIRSANDSYFTAMTYPEGIPATMKPTDIHDALWGVLSAVYGGAVHPTAEGYAAMADAALPLARSVLGLAAAPAVSAEPLPPPAPTSAPAPAQPLAPSSIAPPAPATPPAPAAPSVPPSAPLAVTPSPLPIFPPAPRP
jgi:hypothetical protein